MESHLISVIIPAHNSASTIGTAIQSMLDQTWKNLEIIVIDDCSTDDTKSAVELFIKKDPRVSYYRLPIDDPERVNKHGRNVNAGYMARNYGFEKSHGEYITFQDADDASFRNRIEAQYGLLKKYNASHITTDCQEFNAKFLNKRFDMDKFIADGNAKVFDPKEIYALSKKTKGIAFSVLGSFHSKIDFEIKRARVINKLFFGTLESYPGTGGIPMFKRDIMETVKFRKVNERVWPSFTGRGADRDFDFQVAEKFKNSWTVLVPLYMWRRPGLNEKFTMNIEKYIID